MHPPPRIGGSQGLRWSSKTAARPEHHVSSSHPGVRVGDALHVRAESRPAGAGESARSPCDMRGNCLPPKRGEGAKSVDLARAQKRQITFVGSGEQLISAARGSEGQRGLPVRRKVPPSPESGKVACKVRAGGSMEGGVLIRHFAGEGVRKRCKG